eukprot:SAG31_NODE_8242_length_1491_cov_1.010776_3_plen_65_part_00
MVGAARGSDVRTQFSKLRINPRTLMVKTDDYTFAQTAGHLVQTYWNGQRRVLCVLAFAVVMAIM